MWRNTIASIPSHIELRLKGSWCQFFYFNSQWTIVFLWYWPICGYETQTTWHVYLIHLLFVHHFSGIFFGEASPRLKYISKMALGAALQSIYDLKISENYNKDIKILASSIQSKKNNLHSFLGFLRFINWWVAAG